MTEAHPLRCKNGCHNLECEYCPDASDHEKRGKPLREKLIIWAFTTKHGCNSFSVHDFPSENSSAKSDAVLGVGVDYILQKLEQEYDDGGYDPDIPLWIQVRDDLKKLRTKEREQG